MVFDVSKVSGISDYSSEVIKVGEGVDTEEVTVYRVATAILEDKVDSPDYVDEGPRAFLVVRKNTIEVRCDTKLSKLLREKYESVMESRYFGRGGLEIVNAGQLKEEELNDLVRLSYKLSEE